MKLNGIEISKKDDSPGGCAAFVLLSLGLLCWGLVTAVGGCMPSYSDGERTGTVTKVSRKGIIWKSYEGQMNVGAMGAQGGVAIPVQWQFSIQDEKVAQALNRAAEAGRPVTLVYHQFLVRPMSISTDYVIDEVKGQAPTPTIPNDGDGPATRSRP